MKILKFGASTLADAASIDKVVAIIAAEQKKNKDICVVVSSLKNVTTDLEEISKQALSGESTYRELLQLLEERHFNIVKKFVDVKHQAKVLANIKVILNDLEDILHGVFLLWELSPRTVDHIQTYGVRISAYMLSEILKSKGIEVQYVDSQSIIVTDNVFANAHVQVEDSEKKIKDHFKKSKGIQIITGQIGASLKGESTSLGRDGTSYTASLIGAVLNAEIIEIYTDRDGIMNADPDMVKKAYSLDSLTFAEAMELSNFGTRVIYPPALQPAFKKGIPVLIKNLYNPKFKGTLIKKRLDDSGTFKAISSIKNVSLLTIQGSGMIGTAGVAARVFGTLATHQISIVMITQASSEQSITLAISPQDGAKAVDVLKKEFAEELRLEIIDKISQKEKMAVIAAIGDNMQQTPGIAGKMFTVLGKNSINISAIAQGSSELNITIILENKDLEKALNVLHESFF
ncbi:MAG: aspartate kinase [Bacteroidota bacterium]|nr:aspartate kinase [Bacteroidota bacterium]